MELVQIGYTKKVHGVKGEIKIHIEDYYLKDAKQADVFFIEIKGQQLPYFIEKLQFGNAIIAKFEEVDRKEDAVMLSGNPISMKEQDLLPEEQREFDLANDFKYFEGFLIKEMELGDIGIIDEVVEMPEQFMAFLSYQEKEVMVPLNEFFIQDIDPENKIILMELPEGIFDI